MKIGLLLGSFDPIHNGHIALAMEALEKRLVDKVLFVPTVQNPTKPKHTFDYKTRLKMCAKVATDMNLNCFFEHIGFFGQKVDVSDIESHIREEVVYTYMVLERLANAHKGQDELCIICGSDITEQIKTWKNGQWILDNFEIINLVRMGEELEGETKKKVGIAVSSSDIRKLIAKGISPYPYVPLTVMQDIKIYKEFNN